MPFHDSAPARPVPHGARRPVDAARLATALGETIRGEVRFDDGSRALYATDGSNYRQPPIGVIVPRDAADVERALAVCRRHEAPVFARGGGTSLAGQCCNAAVCFDFSKYMNRVLDVDAANRRATVEPGTILDDLRHAAERHGLTFGPDPATHDHCTLGGMIGNDSCGVHSVMAQFAGGGARTADNVHALDIVTYDGVRMRVGPTGPDELDAIVRQRGRRGQIYAALRDLRERHAHDIRSGFPQLPRRVSGYNLEYLLPENGCNIARALVGSEGTCVMVLQAVVDLIPNPPARTLVVLGYPSVYDAGADVPRILEARPIGLEGIDDRLVRDMRTAGVHTKHLGLLPEGQGWLLVEFGGETRDDADAQAHALARRLSAQSHPPSIRRFDDRSQEEEIWKIRESGLGATAHVSQARPTWPGWEDSAVPPAKVGEYLRALRSLLDKYGYQCALYGHFGQGCIHTRIDFDLKTADGIARYRAFAGEAADLVVSCGGSLSGEHGDGQARGELLPRMFSPPVMAAFREFKAIWDPRAMMNPGTGVDADPIDLHLRLGPHYNPPRQETHFQYPRDSGSFAKAALRCVGVGECRRLDGGTMCPSFMITREEKHSTRGRARLLFEMLQGDPLTGGWQSEHVKEALDLCLACKGCRHDCPVKVDMATYKAEFLAHYYEGHRRPISAYAFGLIHHWARLGALAPRAVNLLTQTPGLRDVAKRAVGMAPARQIPPFAPFTFRQWFATRPPRPHNGRPAVLLWPDTFNDHFHPHTAIAAVQVLERAGFRVRVPRHAMCCGRPLYDYGMLPLARTWLQRILRELGPQIEAGLPVIGLEPSCTAVFRDELTELLPQDENALRLSKQTFTLGEWLDRNDADVPRLERRALVHGHCHHKSVMGFDADRRILERVGLTCDVLDSGCCGMAGSFGFERDHYDLSQQVGERVLLPAVRGARKDVLIVADGFSCRTQIGQNTPRRALHLAEVLEMAAREGPHGPAGDCPERSYVPDYAAAARPSGRAVTRTAGAIGFVLGAAAVHGIVRRRHEHGRMRRAPGLARSGRHGGADESPREERRR